MFGAVRQKRIAFISFTSDNILVVSAVRRVEVDAGAV